MDNKDRMMGVSSSLLKENITEPINGLRHPIGEDTNGWYLWTGEYSEEKDFFKPIHESHMVDKYPQLKKYLQLPVGFRFLIDNNGHEDIWSDDDLLNV